MKNSTRLVRAMAPGRVYRRQELNGKTTAIDRDLKNLVKRGAVRKLHGGLYCVPIRTALGPKLPSNEAMIRAFLKTDDFLITSYNYFNQLELGLTQLSNEFVVYNHKRSGRFSLGGRRFRFRLLPAYPKTLSREFLLVDLLNNLYSLPDDATLVERNLKGELGKYDRKVLEECLELYGRPVARRLFEAADD